VKKAAVRPDENGSRAGSVGCAEMHRV